MEEVTREKCRRAADIVGGTDPFILWLRVYSFLAGEVGGGRIDSECGVGDSGTTLVDLFSPRGEAGKSRLVDPCW